MCSSDLFIRAFQFLKAQRIWLLFVKELDDLLDTQTDGIDIPTYDFQNGLRFKFVRIISGPVNSSGKGS